MRMLGIDCDSKKIALVCLKQNGKVDCYIMFSSSTEDKYKRLEDLITIFEGQIKAINPDKVFIEEAIYIQNFQTSRAISEVIGNIKVVLTRANIPFQMVPVNSWKKAIIGKGNASKEEVKQFVIKKYPDFEEEPQDIADACCLAMYGLKKESEDN